MTQRCARCRRSLTTEPILIAGKGYGPVCAERLGGGDLATPTKAKRTRLFAVVRRVRRGDERQLPLLEVAA